jgi:hypothetical protein
MIATGMALVAALALFPAQGASRTRSAQKPKVEAPAAAGEQKTPEVVELRKAVEALTAQIDRLRADIARREAADAATVDRLQVLLLDERAARLKREIADMRRLVQVAQNREDDLERRLENIDTELIVYGGLNRQDSERAIRASLTRQIQEEQREQQALLREQAALERELAATEREAAAVRARLRGMPGAARPASEPPAEDPTPPPPDEPPAESPLR